MTTDKKYPAIPTIMTICGVLLLSGLCYWQIERLFWKTELFDQLTMRVDNDPVPLPALDRLDIDEWQFRPVQITGEFIHDQEIHVLARELNGEEGFHIYTPFKRSDVAQGAQDLILINRGYVHFDNKAQSSRLEGLTDGEISLQGIMRFDKGIDRIRQMVLPDHDVEDNLWYALDIDKINQEMGLNLPKYYIMDGNDQVQGGHPKGKQWKLDIRNNHLSYAITWGMLAIGFAVIYFIYLQNWRKEEGKEDE